MCGCRASRTSVGGKKNERNEARGQTNAHRVLGNIYYGRIEEKKTPEFTDGSAHHRLQLRKSIGIQISVQSSPLA